MINRSKSLSLLIMASILLGLNANPTNALERRSTQEIPVEELVKEIIKLVEIDSSSLGVIYYIPLEVFGAKSQEQVIIIAAAKVEILSPERFKFTAESELQKELKVAYIDSSGQSVALTPGSKTADISGFITYMKPFLSKFAGRFGEGLQLFVYKNVNSSGKTIVSPYEFGKLKISLDGKDEKQIVSEIDLPLNSLFIPRLCSNGKPAHVSWKYCPWDGTPLPAK